MPSKKSSFRRSQRNLRIEPLENRRLFAADLGGLDDYWLIPGTEGNDVITVEQHGIMLTARVNDEVHYRPSFLCKGVAVQAKAGNDSVEIDSSVKLRTRLHGGAGDDTIVGSLQDDVISGGWGNDEIYARAGNDQVWGDQMPIPQSPLLQPNNRLVEQVGLVVQPSGGEVVPPASDIIWGGNGNDSLHGGPGNDVLFGEVGEISSAQPPAPQHPELLQQPDPKLYPLHTYDDELRGDEGEDILHGGPGEDFFHGGEDVDVVFAVDGYVDTILPGPGDIIFMDAIDRMAPWPPELVQKPDVTTRDSATGHVLKWTTLYIDEPASKPGPALTALPTNRPDYFDVDDWLEDLIDEWEWVD